MKSLVHSLLLLTLMLAMGSCSKDDKDTDFATPTNLTGTTWQCANGLAWDADLEYLNLKFISATGVQGWSKRKNTALQQDWIGTYTISGKTITIDEGEQGEIITGILNGVSMEFSNGEGTGSLTFTLQ